MSIFGKIKDAIFGRKAQAQPAPTTATVGQAQPSATAAPAPAPAAQAAPQPMEQVDVEANLARMAEGKNLNWRTSIVDLMKLVGIESSLENRKELARELGYTGELEGSAEMNMWLHKAVMRELAANGGKVPAELTD
jgi:3-oxoacyl-ACP reductase-like protein